MIKHRLPVSIMIALLVVASLSTLMVYGLPILAKSKIPMLIQQKTGRNTSLDKCQFTLLPLSVQLQNIALQENTGKPFASIASFYVRLNIWQSFKQSAVVIDKLAITKPVVHIIKQKNGKFNFDDLFKNQTEQQDSPVFPVSIAKLSLSEGKLTWDDSLNREIIQPINLTVNNLDTIASKKCQLDLQLTNESGGKLSWQGELGIHPLLSEGHITLNSINLHRLLSVILPASLPFSVDGSGSLDSDYQVRYNKNTLTLTAAQAKIKLHHFQYAQKQQNPVIVKTADFTHETDLKITYSNNSYSLIANKSKINLHNFEFSQSTPGKTQIKAANFVHETNIKINYADNNWQFFADKSRIKLHDFEFSELTPNKTLLKTANFTHETDFKISNTRDDWQFMFKQSKMAASQLQFSIADADNLTIKTAMLGYETDSAIQSIKQIWQLSTNKAKINAQDLVLNYANATFKTPSLLLETSVDGHFSDDAQIITRQGRLNSHRLELYEKNQNKPLISIPDLAVQGMDFNLKKQALKINAITADSANIRTVLNAKGIFNYQKLFTSEKTANAEAKISHATVKNSTPPWVVNINQMALTKLESIFEDQSQNKPVITTLKALDFKLTGYNNQSAAKLPFQLHSGVNKTGSIQLNGDIVLEPFSAQLAINAKAIELAPFQAYFEKLAHLDIIDGKFTTNGKLTIAIPEKQPPDLKFTGDSSITELVTRDQNRHRDFIKWKNLSLKNLAVDLRKDSYTADTLVINKPYVKVSIRKDKTTNFDTVFMTDSASGKASAKTTSASPAQTYFKLDKLQIVDGSSDFSDRSLILPFTVQIKSLDGGANEISSNKKSTTKFSLKGTVYDLAPVDIDGHINPYSGNHDLSVNFQGMPMPLISSYMVEFAGYKVEKGKMSLKLKYKLADGELTASNNILIDQFELGEKVDNPKAVSLPLEMAVALLKDSDGKINIDVPITGSLDDPQFSLGAIISDALANAISKIISSPFQALSSLLGDDEESISTVTFKAGDAVLDKVQQDKLTALAKLLKERSVLILDIKGAAFQAQDWPAIQEVALYDSLKIIKADEINKQEGNTKILPDYVQLSEADYKRLLAEQFIAKFPNLAKKSFFGKPELIDAKAGDFYESARQHLGAGLKREPRLKKLAALRAQAVASYLVQKSGVPHEQIFILDPVIDPTRDNKEINTILSLKAR
jgi:hypothetical protein